jgi:cell division protein FtsL
MAKKVKVSEGYTAAEKKEMKQRLTELLSQQRELRRADEEDLDRMSAANQPERQVELTQEIDRLQETISELENRMWALQSDLRDLQNPPEVELLREQRNTVSRFHKVSCIDGYPEPGQPLEYKGTVVPYSVWEPMKLRGEVAAEIRQLQSRLRSEDEE